MLTPDVVTGIILLAGSISVAGYAAIRDRSAATQLKDQLTRLDARNTERDELLDARTKLLEEWRRYATRQSVAWRHYMNVLISWGAHSTEEPPRVAPEPPDSLWEDGPE